MERLARWFALAEASGRDKGLRGASGFWLAVWVAMVSFRHVRKWAQPEPVVVREVLGPGQQLVISHFAKGTEPPPPVAAGRSRRARRRATARAS